MIRAGDMTSPEAWAVRLRSDLPFDVYGYTDHRARTIVLRDGLNLAEARATLLHEGHHAERGPVSPTATPMEEGVVELLSAAQQIASRDLVDLRARVRSQGEDAVAVALGVDCITVVSGMHLAAAAQRCSRAKD